MLSGMASPLFNDMLAVLVLYKKRPDESETFSSLKRPVSEGADPIDIVIYDNGPVSRQRDEETGCEGFRVHYMSDPSNPGVSKAYNAAYDLARQLKKKWLLLLDQDTLFPEGALDVYAANIARYPEAALIVPMLVCDGRVYSPCHRVMSVGFPLRSIRPGWLKTNGLGVLNSGLCIRLDAFEKTGGFDERIPLDFADHDFMRRYAKHFERFLLVDVVCQHGFSDSQTSDIDISLARFDRYCKGAKSSIKSAADPFLLLPLVLFRATRLSLRFRSIRFLRLFALTFLRS
jgi:GT2 family glycosyltransferase